MSSSLRFLLAAALTVFCLTAAPARAVLAVPEPLPPAIPAPADADHGDVGHTKVYWVYYRWSLASRWVCYGGYHSDAKAHAAVLYFRSKGYSAYYR